MIDENLTHRTGLHELEEIEFSRRIATFWKDSEYVKIYKTWSEKMDQFDAAGRVKVLGGRRTIFDEDGNLAREVNEALSDNILKIRVLLERAIFQKVKIIGGSYIFFPGNLRLKDLINEALNNAIKADSMCEAGPVAVDVVQDVNKKVMFIITQNSPITLVDFQSESGSRGNGLKAMRESEVARFGFEENKTIIVAEPLPHVLELYEAFRTEILSEVSEEAVDKRDIVLLEGQPVPPTPDNVKLDRLTDEWGKEDGTFNMITRRYSPGTVPIEW